MAQEYKDEQRARLGQQMGEYRLIRLLGSGGFGDVYLGEHLRNQSHAAIKILHARLLRSSELKEFINEARTIRLHHPHIVSLLDFGIGPDDSPFLVMAYAAHGTLRTRHPKGSCLPLALISSYVTSIASALQYAHELHMIHRDVKPENILLDETDSVLLSDFGILAVAQSTHAFASQGVAGTLPYMAPEQLQGQPRASSDQYALARVALWGTSLSRDHNRDCDATPDHAAAIITYEGANATTRGRGGSFPGTF